MAHESKNLTLRRSSVNVWEQPGWTPDTTAWDRERLVAGLWGAGLAIVGAWRRGVLGTLLGAAGLGLAVRAASGHHDFARGRAWTDRLLRSRGWRGEDVVYDASDESFPASDAPSWTPTAGAKSRG